MDSAEQLRILEGAKGHPGRLALATVDLAYGDLKEDERATLKIALKAAALPHWVNESILATLLSIDQAEAFRLLARLRNLNVVEPFPARGDRAANVHEATRKILRRMMRLEQPERFRSLSAQARQCFTIETGFHMRIEGLYHLFADDQEAAAVECARLDTEATLIAGPQSWLALTAMLSELLSEQWLHGRALLEALLSVNECRISRSETIGVEEAAHTALDVAKEVNDLRSAARAHALIGYIRISQGELALALDARRESLALYERVVSEDPTNLERQRELNTARSKLGDILFQQGQFDEALDTFREALSGSQAVISQNPDNFGWQREGAVAHSKLGDVFFKKGLLSEALEEFQNYKIRFEHLVAQNSNNADWLRELGMAHSRLGEISFAQNNGKAALAAFYQSVAIVETLTARDPTNVGWQRDLTIARSNTALALANLGRRDEAAEILREAEKQIQDWIAVGVMTVQSKKDLADIREELRALTKPEEGDSKVADQDK